ncbi:hypothetical protein FZI85_10950 [Mycobacterium sp. CBMA293]|nr:hypothetical protein [Mycolicibacterium sp. CBMA 360]MUL59056.1 hypothetical protein [Mycolicibacterium sp. CBMA 335]MUL69450.1 hypothetical protein [Mycolicibacterium sp. CBMA 311]MUL94414.1 hypothetical protein [Mycolicibacterium sp. CBMA 230]MUM06569.1 hypothetical protein [Mycolicibacterium sp. CBMA 213]MUM11543.1 hypothetical protein [Mycolicibacterium sp. CBMA 293]MUM30953.1 hypothetical protein [Mycolicibacterium sp. CBMA 361]
MLRDVIRISMAVALALSAGGVVTAAPASAGCETNALGAQYCDTPARPDGTWDRCVNVAPTPFFGQYGQIAGVTPAYGKCWPVNPAEPWPVTPIGQPQYHIYP